MGGGVGVVWMKKKTDSSSRKVKHVFCWTEVRSSDIVQGVGRQESDPKTWQVVVKRLERNVVVVGKTTSWNSAVRYRPESSMTWRKQFSRCFVPYVKCLSWIESVWRLHEEAVRMQRKGLTECSLFLDKQLWKRAWNLSEVYKFDFMECIIDTLWVYVKAFELWRSCGFKAASFMWV